MKKILILFCHPALENSRINRAWIDQLEDLEGITLHDLYERYPNFDVDIQHEQELLAAHDIIILQHPFYWYSPPALLKQWIEMTLTHGWAYGKGGDALKDKIVLSAISTGGSAEAYSAEGFHGKTIGEFLAPIQRSFELCGMHYLPPFLAQGAFTMDEEAVAASAKDYRLLLANLRDKNLKLSEAHSRLCLDPHDSTLFQAEAG